MTAEPMRAIPAVRTRSHTLLTELVLSLAIGLGMLAVDWIWKAVRP